MSSVCLLSTVAIAAGACGADSQQDSGGGVRGGGVAARGGSAFAGRGAPVGPTATAGTSAAPTGTGLGNLGRPMMLPPVMANPANMMGGSGCLDATVLFVVDGSGSMCEVFGNATRWTALRGALLAPMTGLINQLEAEAQFGLMIYDGSIDPAAAGMATMTSPNPACAGFGGFGATQCPRLVQTPPKFMNAAALNTAFPFKELGGSTPTHKAMDAAVAQMMMSAAGKDPKLSPHVIILATDGQPNDICTGGLGGDGSAEKAAVIAAVDRAYAAGIRTFVISLAGTDALLEAHLAEVAKHGDPMNPMAHTYSPASPEQLQADLRTLLGNALGCII